MVEKIQNSIARLIVYCEKEGYKGYDPYDGLNSTLFKSVPYIAKNRFLRLLWIQAFKRSPINLRPAVRISKEYNPKALGLFLSGYCNLFKLTRKEDYLTKIHFFSEKLQELQNKDWSGASWGYNFDWQARAFFQPKNTPTVVATTFIGCALLDAYEITKNNQLLNIARSACNFILKDLNRTYDMNGNFAFSYSPLDKSVVFNASLLGSRLLARVFAITGESELYESATRSVQFCCDNQRIDGSWTYGKQHFHQWVDSFHTGYNLECIADFRQFTGNITFDRNLDEGFKYYIKTFFTHEGIPKYYDNSTYPIDIHSSAQLIITLTKAAVFKEYIILADKVINWTIDNMQSGKGYFYYQVNKSFSSRIPYMRWAQAWMFYSLSMYLLHAGNGSKYEKNQYEKNNVVT